MEDAEKNIFHSSDIAKQTLAGSTSDPFTLTEKDKKRQEKRTRILEKKAEKAAKKTEKKAKREARRQQFKQWRKQHRLIFSISSICAVLIVGLIIFGLGKLAVDLIHKMPHRKDDTKALIDPSDPISVNCQCAKGSDSYNALKSDYAASEQHEQEVIKNFDVKTATTFATTNFIDNVVGVNYSDNAVDSDGNIDVDKVLKNMNDNIESSNITDEDQKNLLKLFTIKAYIIAERYNEATDKLNQYNPDNLYNSGKSVYYHLLYELYQATGNEEEAKNALDAYNAIPNESGSR